MPVVPIQRFDQLVIEHYTKKEQKVVGPVLEWLKSSGLEKVLEGVINKALTAYAQHGVDEALRARQRAVIFNLSVVKMATKFWQSMKPADQKQVHPDVLTLAIKILLEGAGYSIEGDALKYELKFELEGEEEENGSDEPSAMEPAPLLPGPTADSEPFPEIAPTDAA